MSHSKVEASRKRRVFSEEFKQDAVRLVVSENYTFAAAAEGGGHWRAEPAEVACSPGSQARAVRRERLTRRATS
jgi:hypothetical protein